MHRIYNKLSTDEYEKKVLKTYNAKKNMKEYYSVEIIP